MTNSSHDLVILGSDTTAIAAAQRAADLGADVLLVEQAKLGGTCVNWGCVPSKTLIHKAGLYHAARRSRDYGLNLTAAAVSCPELMDVKQRAVNQVRVEHCQQVIDANPKISLLQGHGQFLDRETLQVGSDLIKAERFLIACGGVPRTLDIPGLSQVGALNSYSALNLPCIPKSLIIIGGGVIALEMGQMFQRFGCQVTILERGERPLAEFDERLTAPLCGLLAKEGLHQHFGVETRQIEAVDGGALVLTEVHGREARFEAERIMLAVGTAPATRGAGLDLIGVETTPQGFIAVDSEMRTNVPGIWAAGDVTGPPLIAPAGELEGEVAVENMLTSSRRQVDHRGTPMAVFIDPEIAMVGQNGDQARADGHDVVEEYLDLSAVGKAHIVGQPKGGWLLWAEREGGRILGAQVLSPRAADLIHEVALAVRCGLTVTDLAGLVHVYPSISDGWRLLARRCLKRLSVG